MKILILDDSELDREVIKEEILDAVPTAEILLASNLSEWHEQLARKPQLLFQDIRLSAQGDDSGSGLNALLEVIDEYPSLPVAVCTGYFIEHIDQFLQKFLGRTKQVIHFVDKAAISREVILDIMDKATKYQLEFDVQASRINKAEISLKDKQQRARDTIFSENKAEKLDWYNRAFSGENWEDRFSHEARLFNGMCTMNFLRLTTVLEKTVKEFTTMLAPADAKEILFSQRLQYLSKVTRLPRSKLNQIHEVWGRRNRIVHMGEQATLADGRALARSMVLLNNEK